MIEVTIEDKTFELAENWNDITFAQYLDVSNLVKDKGLNELLKATKIIAALSNSPEECEAYLLRMHKPDFEELGSYFLWTNSKIEDSTVPRDCIEIEGKMYRIKKDYNKITIGEMASIETLISQNKNLDPMEVVFGVLLREDVDGKEKEFNEDDFLYILTQLKDKVMLMDVYSHISFFLSGVQKQSTPTKGFSVRQKQTNISSEE